MLTCPNDKTPLTAVEVEGVPLDQCLKCGGYWLQRGELETLGEHHDAHLDPIKVGNVGRVDSKRSCPQDGTRLIEHEFVEHTGVRSISARRARESGWKSMNRRTCSITWMKVFSGSRRLTSA